MVLPHGAVGWSAVCDCGIFWSYLLFHTLVVFSFKKASEYDQEMPQSHTQTIKVKQPALSLPQRDDSKTRKYIKYCTTNVSVAQW